MQVAVVQEKQHKPAECISPQDGQEHGFRFAEGQPHGFDASMRPLESLEKYKEGPLEKFVHDIGTLLVNEAKRALDFNYDQGLDYAAILLDEARKYDSIYPYARAVSNETMGKAAGCTRNWNARQPT